MEKRKEKEDVKKNKNKGGKNEEEEYLEKDYKRLQTVLDLQVLDKLFHSKSECHSQSIHSV